jgi:hypothetical protein
MSIFELAVVELLVMKQWVLRVLLDVRAIGAVSIEAIGVKTIQRGQRRRGRC